MTLHLKAYLVTLQTGITISDFMFEILSRCTEDNDYSRWDLGNFTDYDGTSCDSADMNERYPEHCSRGLGCFVNRGR